MTTSSAAEDVEELMDNNSQLLCAHHLCCGYRIEHLLLKLDPLFQTIVTNCFHSYKMKWTLYCNGVGIELLCEYHTFHGLSSSSWCFLTVCCHIFRTAFSVSSTVTAVCSSVINCSASVIHNLRWLQFLFFARFFQLFILVPLLVGQKYNCITSLKVSLSFLKFCILSSSVVTSSHL